MVKKTLNDWQFKASQYITGGMSSNARANKFTNVPMFGVKADGARFIDLSGKDYIDFFMCHGAVMLGHNHPSIKKAIINTLEKGFYAGMDTQETIEFAQKVCQVIPSAEEIRFVNSGTEGTLLALRLARRYTGKNAIIRIDGHFHGMQDYLLANNLVNKVDKDNDGNRISKTIGRTAGVPDIVDNLAIPIPWNNIEIMEKVLEERIKKIGAIIMNVIDFNNGCFLTTSEYLHKVRTLADKYNVVLIFDEILSGFKTGISCGQGYYKVTPDISVLGKALSNGVPQAIVVGKKEIMKNVMDPIDPVMAGGTFTGNQLGIAAGNIVLEILSQDGFYEEYLPRAEKFYKDLQKLFNNYEFPAVVQWLGAGFYIFIGTNEPIKNYSDLKKVDKPLTKDFFTACIKNGLYFHTDFTVSAAHDSKTLDEALYKFEDVLKEILEKK